MNQNYRLKESQINYLLNATKIAIIIAMGIFLLGFFFAFYEYPNDARGYGLHSIRIANGEYEYTNELLESTGKWEFVPGSQLKTIHNTSIPDSMQGVAVVGSISYLIAGYNGLFYLGPLIMISILILSERMATHYFGKYVGLLTLIFLATNEFIFWVGRGLLTSNFFTLFFLLGCFYLIRFLKYRNEKYILLASVFFTMPIFFRLNGIMLVPIEILIVFGYFIIQFIRDRRNRTFKEQEFSFSRQFFNKFFRKKTLKILGLMIGPFVVFLLFYFSFNTYVFGEPTITVYSVPDQPGKDLSVTKLENFFKINWERVEKYFNHFLPYPINRIDGLITDYEVVQQQVNDPWGSKMLSLITNNGENISGFHLGILSFLILISSFLIALRGENRLEIIVFSIFIAAFIIFYSTLLLSWNRQGSGRDMLPVYPLFYMLLGYLIIKILKLKTSGQIKNNKNKIFQSGKVFLVIVLFVFISGSFFYADYSQIIKNEGLNFKNPSIAAKGFPIDLGEISKDSIIITHYHAHSVIAYGAIPFQATGLGRSIDDPIYQNMLQTLEDTINKGYDVYVFKEPVLESERDFKVEFGTETKFVLKDYSDIFCKVEFDNTDTKESDKACLEEWKETRHWLQ